MNEDKVKQDSTPAINSDDMRSLAYLLQNVKSVSQVADGPLDIAVHE